MAKHGPLSGQKLANEKYVLGELLGSGGMGAVYKAHDARLNRLVAVKVMSPQGHVSPEELKRFTQLFQDEARRLASLKHTSIPHIYDHFEETGYWFLVMEFIEGETLKDVLDRRGGLLPVEEVLPIGLQLADVLEYLHTRQQPIIFRDLKPANVMLTPSGQVYLIDFGIARLFTPGKNQDTLVFLTPGYAAPEQHGTAQTTERSDIYSLGATLHHLLSGTHPASSPFLFTPLPIQQPFQLASLLAQMVALDPANRPASMAVVKEALQHIRNQAAANSSTNAGLVPPAPVQPVSFAPTQPSPLAAPTTPAVNPPAGIAWAQAGTPTQVDFVSSSSIPSVGNLPPATRSGPPRGTTLAIHESPEVSALMVPPPQEQRWNAESSFALGWSPNGQQIASGSSQKYPYIDSYKWAGRIEAWDAMTGKILDVYEMIRPRYGRSYEEFTPQLMDAIVWSPDGKYVVVLGRKGTLIWELKARREVKRKVKGTFWPREREVVESVDPVAGTLYNNNSSADLVLWSPDVSKVAILSGYGTTLAVASLRGREPVQRSLSSPCNGQVVAWSPDSTRIAWGTKNEIPVWNVSSSEQEGHHLLTYREHRSPVADVSWSADGRQITSRSEDGSTHVWDAGSGQTLGTFTGPAEKIKKPDSLQFTVKARNAISPDGTLKAVPTDEGIELQTVAGGATVFVYRGHCSDKTAERWSPEVMSLVWSPDGTRIAFARFDGKIYVWQAI